MCYHHSCLSEVQLLTVIKQHFFPHKSPGCISFLLSFYQSFHLCFISVHNRSWIRELQVNADGDTSSLVLRGLISEVVRFYSQISWTLAKILCMFLSYSDAFALYFVPRYVYMQFHMLRFILPSHQICDIVTP